jgi:putative hydrolase of the HAD superfamily
MIRNIIFDFGGVIYNIDHNLSKRAFENLQLKNFDKIYGHEIQVALFESLERGEIEEQAFRNELKKLFSTPVTDQQIDDAWCALLIDFDRKIIDLLADLSKNYRLFLLSNSNIIHYKRFMAHLNSYSNFRALFTDVWFSHERGMRKPDAIIYQSLLRANNLSAQETLFIDDLDVNIEAAKNLGIKTHYLHQQKLGDLFENGRLKLDYN